MHHDPPIICSRIVFEMMKYIQYSSTRHHAIAYMLCIMFILYHCTVSSAMTMRCKAIHYKYYIDTCIMIRCCWS
uniref:Uncharacterized protein n=1 Tax=Anguilla anguilla TaxID=7936 RepID=A0A0E9PSJ9_ANGAN